MTEDWLEACNSRWEPKGSVHLRQLASGNFALYPHGGASNPYWIGRGEDIAQAYAQRPAPTIRPRVVLENKITRGINVALLEIDI